MKPCPHRHGGLVSELIDQEELVLARSDEGIDRLHHRGGRSKPRRPLRLAPRSCWRHESSVVEGQGTGLADIGRDLVFKGHVTLEQLLRVPRGLV
jgi:hypothetical protein